jgi:hypothetical protein
VRAAEGVAWNGEVAADNMHAANAVVLAMYRMMNEASAGTPWLCKWQFHLLVVVLLLGGDSTTE